MPDEQFPSYILCIELRYLLSVHSSLAQFIDSSHCQSNF